MLSFKPGCYLYLFFSNTNIIISAKFVSVSYLLAFPRAFHILGQVAGNHIYSQPNRPWLVCITIIDRLHALVPLDGYVTGRIERDFLCASNALPNELCY